MGSEMCIRDSCGELEGFAVVDRIGGYQEGKSPLFKGEARECLLGMSPAAVEGSQPSSPSVLRGEGFFREWAQDQESLKIAESFCQSDQAEAGQLPSRALLGIALIGMVDQKLHIATGTTDNPINIVFNCLV